MYGELRTLTKVRSSWSSSILHASKIMPQFTLPSDHPTSVAQVAVNSKSHDLSNATSLCGDNLIFNLKLALKSIAIQLQLEQNLLFMMETTDNASSSPQSGAATPTIHSVSKLVLHNTPKSLRPYVYAVMAFKKGHRFQRRGSVSEKNRISQMVQEEGKFAAALKVGLLIPCYTSDY